MNKTMNSAARQVLVQLERSTGVTPTEEDEQIALFLSIIYYPNFLVGLIHRMHSTDKPESNELKYYFKPAMSIDKGRRPRAMMWPLQDIKDAWPIIKAVQAYLLVDWSMNELGALRAIAQSGIGLADLSAAIKEAEDWQVRSIPYLAKIVEKTQAQAQADRQARARLRETQEASRQVESSTPAVHHSTLDVVNKAMGWADLLNSAELMNRSKQINEQNNRP